MSPAEDPWTRPFLPEALLPLAFTPSWRRLSAADRLRYNQLQGLYFHEQIIYFEQAIIVPLVTALRPHVRDAGLRDALEVFAAEENRHSAEFHALLRDLRPDWYGAGWGHFVQTGPLARAALRCMLRHPRRFPFLIWLVQLLEERTMWASRLYLAEAERFPAVIVAVQRQHLIDEADHVQWDAALLEQFWTAASPRLRRVNARLLDWMLGEFIAVPRRAALRVVDALAAERPDLAVPAATLKAELRALARRADFRSAVFGRDAVPRTAKLAATAPDLQNLAATWLSHEHTATPGPAI